MRKINGVGRKKKEARNPSWCRFFVASVLSVFSVSLNWVTGWAAELHLGQFDDSSNRKSICAGRNDE